MKRRWLAVWFCLVGMLLAGYSLPADAADTMGDYRSKASGNWGDASTWEYYDGNSWVAATDTPTNASDMITIRTGHTVTVAASVTVDQVTIAAGGQVTVDSGVTWTIANGDGTDLSVDGTVSNAGTIGQSGATLAFNGGSTYEHAQNGGTIPTATWASTSTLLVTGWTTGKNYLGGLSGQSFGDFVWNSPAQGYGVNLKGTLTSVQGNLMIMSTGDASQLRLSGSTAYTLAVGGDVVVSGGYLDLANGDASPADLIIGGDFNQTGGTFTRSAASVSVMKFGGGDSSAVFTETIDAFDNTGLDFLVDAGKTLTLGSVLTVASSRAITIATGGMLDLGAQTLTVAGSLTNNGTLRQTRAVISGTVEFLKITDSASAVKYYGVDITPSGDMGEVTVEVAGNQKCPNANGLPILRCHRITPTTAQSADIRFYFRQAEMQGQTLASTDVWRYSDGAWTGAGVNRTGDSGSCTAGAINCYVAATVTSYSDFQLKESSPTAVQLVELRAAQAGRAVELAWETVSEIDNLGFNIYRAHAAEGPWRRLNPALIPSAAPGSPAGQAYHWDDLTVPGPGTYFYQLEAVGYGGERETLGIADVVYVLPERVWLPLAF